MFDIMFCNKNKLHGESLPSSKSTVIDFIKLFRHGCQERFKVTFLFPFIQSEKVLGKI